MLICRQVTLLVSLALFSFEDSTEYESILLESRMGRSSPCCLVLHEGTAILHSLFLSPATYTHERVYSCVLPFHGNYKARSFFSRLHPVSNMQSASSTRCLSPLQPPTATIWHQIHVNFSRFRVQNFYRSGNAILFLTSQLRQHRRFPYWCHFSPRGDNGGEEDDSC